VHPTPSILNAPSILILGGAGFIGRECARDLLGRGWRVVVLDDLSAGDQAQLSRVAPGAEFHEGDARDSQNLARLLRELGPFQRVLHLAGRVGVGCVLDDPEGCRALTRDLAQSLCEALGPLPQAQRPRILAASTSEVYCDGQGLLGEDAPLRSAKGQGRWAYAASRVEAEQVLDRWWTNLHGSRDPGAEGPIHLRFFNVTGPGHDPRTGMVLPRFIQAARTGECLPVHGDGLQERTFAHVRDLGRDIGDLIEMGNAPGGPLNLGGVAHTSMIDLARLVLEAAGQPVDHIAHVDPCAVHPSFEEVRRRAPQLDRAHKLGLCLGHRGLLELVHEMLDSPADFDNPGSHALLPCASPASSPA